MFDRVINTPLNTVENLSQDTERTEKKLLVVKLQLK